MKFLHQIFIAAFCGFLVFPWVNKIIPIVDQLKSSENRALAKFPDMDTCKLNKIPFFLESYLVDRLSMRNNWIRFYNRLNIFVFKSSPASLKAFVGKNGWLFLSGEELKTYVGTSLFSQNELEEFRNEMRRRRAIITSYNAKLIIAIVPNKANIYPEYMPDHLAKSEHGGYGQQMYNFLRENGLPVVDLYTTLLQNKTGSITYFKTDNHWNDLGAFIGCNAILKEMQKDFPSVELLDTAKYPLKIKREKPGVIAEMLSIENESSDINYCPTPASYKASIYLQKKYGVMKDFPYTNEYETVYEQKDTSLPGVLIIRDSFAKRLLPYLAEECSACTAIWDAWHYGLNEAIIKDIRPNFVIYLISESQLKNVMKFQNSQTTP